MKYTILMLSSLIALTLGFNAVAEDAAADDKKEEPAKAEEDVKADSTYLHTLYNAMVAADDDDDKDKDKGKEKENYMKAAAQFMDEMKKDDDGKDEEPAPAEEPAAK